MLYYILGMFTVLIPPDNLRTYKCLFSVVIKLDSCKCCKDLGSLLLVHFACRIVETCDTKTIFY